MSDPTEQELPDEEHDYDITVSGRATCTINFCATFTITANSPEEAEELFKADIHNHLLDEFNVLQDADLDIDTVPQLTVDSIVRGD